MEQQAFIPMSVHGRTRVVSVPVSDEAQDYARRLEEDARVLEASKRRLYYRGEQYAQENADTAKALNLAATQRLPEHQRKHAYSTQIQESVDFLADRLGKGFTIKAAAPDVQAVIDAMVLATDVIAAENEDGDVEVVTDEPLRDAMVAGDTPVHVRWDPVEGTAYLEFWESEHVEFVWASTRVLTEVVRREVIWVIDDANQNRQVTEKQKYDMAPNEFGIMECRRQTFWDDETDPREIEWLGLGRIPWMALRADAKGLRVLRGESLISEQAMESADRYNAVEQTSWLIARYNSHGNVVVVGDGASLKLESDGRVSKDVADVLTFPGGTAVSSLTLPTDPKMIQHQRQVLADALYGAFGLVRVEPDTISGMGSVTGYALEILNQRSEGTFSRVARYWRKDWAKLIDLMLDVVAWKRDAPIGLVDMATGEFVQAPADGMDFVVPEGTLPAVHWWSVDPALVFPNRKVEIRLGTGYIVDEVMVRDDFTANLISRKEALRQRGYGDDEITKIEQEIKDATPAPPETAPGFGNLRTTPPGAPAPTGTAAGRTVAGTTARQ